MYYAGIGSRECPEWVLEIIEKTAYWLAKKGIVLRSGGAEGCDLAFEKGCDLAKGRKEIFLPWRKFNNSKSIYYLPEKPLGEENPFKYCKEEVKLAEKYHPCFNKLSDGSKRLIMRDGFQVLGADLKTPSKFILCYTKNGSGAGGTGQALRIAKDYNIPVFDFGKYKDIDICRKAFNNFIAKVLS